MGQTRKNLLSYRDRHLSKIKLDKSSFSPYNTCHESNKEKSKGVILC